MKSLPSKRSLVFLLFVLPIWFSCNKTDQSFDGKDGIKIVKYPNGKMKVSSEYKNGYLNGRFAEYYEDGKVESEIYYKDNLKEGVFNEYYQDGQLKASMYFRKSLKDSICSYYYKDGQLKRQENYKKGKQDGPLKSFHENGKVASELNFKEGKKHGVQKYYYESGQLKAITNYNEGQPGTNLEEYTKEGKRIKYDFKLLTEEVNKLALDEVFIYKFKFNKPSEDDRIFVGDLVDGKYLPTESTSMIREKGYWLKHFFVPRNSFIQDNLTVIAVTRTHFGHDLILTKKINVALNNFTY